MLALRGRAALVRGYYLMRPLLPRPVQLSLRRSFTRVQARQHLSRLAGRGQPARPVRWLFATIAEAGGGPVPFLDLWPDGRSWALVLTHDVETDVGYRRDGPAARPERELRLPVVMEFRPRERYRVDGRDVVRKLQERAARRRARPRHDGRDLGSSAAAGKAAARNAGGRRSAGTPSGSAPRRTQRRWELMPRLGFDYDSSYSDTDPYEPQPGGCCTYLPYFNASMVELPITLPQDHTLFSILQNSTRAYWLRKASSSASSRDGARAHSPGLRRDPDMAGGVPGAAGPVPGGRTVWHALPGGRAWWRDRACSVIGGVHGNWRIEGPASANGRIRFACPDSSRESAPGLPVATRFPAGRCGHHRCASPDPGPSSGPVSVSRGWRE